MNEMINHQLIMTEATRRKVFGCKERICKNRCKVKVTIGYKFSFSAWLIEWIVILMYSMNGNCFYVKLDKSTRHVYFLLTIWELNISPCISVTAKNKTFYNYMNHIQERTKSNKFQWQQTNLKVSHPVWAWKWFVLMRRN